MSSKDTIEDYRRDVLYYLASLMQTSRSEKGICDLIDDGSDEEE